jgi:hypothetical protein
MSEIHALAGQVALVLGVIAAIASVLLVVAHRTPGTVYLGGIVWVIGATVLAAVLGVAVVIGGRLPSDGLHILYGILAVAVLPGSAFIASGREARQRAIIAAIGTIVLAILLVRLLQTGA